MYNVLKNNKIEVKDLQEKEHVALLYLNVFFQNMRKRIANENKVEHYLKIYNNLLVEIDLINSKKAHGEDLF